MKIVSRLLGLLGGSVLVGVFFHSFVFSAQQKARLGLPEEISGSALIFLIAGGVLFLALGGLGSASKS